MAAPGMTIVVNATKVTLEASTWPSGSALILAN